MNSAIERLLSLRVRDVMNTDVFCLSDNDTMANAAIEFNKHDITGAPVVNHTGQVVGILSVTDFALREQEHAEYDERLGFGFAHRVAKNDSPIRVEVVQEDRVGTHMSAFVQTVPQDATILNAARILVNEHIHRLVIVDDDQRPIGFLSSLDLVACLVAVVEE